MNFSPLQSPGTGARWWRDPSVLTASTLQMSLCVEIRFPFPKLCSGGPRTSCLREGVGEDLPSLQRATVEGWGLQGRRGRGTFKSPPATSPASPVAVIWARQGKAFKQWLPNLCLQMLRTDNCPLPQPGPAENCSPWTCYASPLDNKTGSSTLKALSRLQGKVGHLWWPHPSSQSQTLQHGELQSDSDHSPQPSSKGTRDPSIKNGFNTQQVTQILLISFLQ